MSVRGGDLPLNSNTFRSPPQVFHLSVRIWGAGPVMPAGSGAAWTHIWRRCNCTYPYWMQFGASKVDSRSNNSEGGKHQRAQTSEEKKKKKNVRVTEVTRIFYWYFFFVVAFFFKIFLNFFYFFVSFLSDIQACTGGISLIPPPPPPSRSLFKVCDKRVRRAMSL